MTALDRRPWIAPLVLLALGVALSAWTWRGWGDPLIDFGRELYTPWRLAEGEVLHRDIAWFNGPLSQYFNASCFAIFGTSYSTLIFVNHALVALAGFLLWGIVREMACRATALVAVASWLTLFCFLQLDIIANSNWIAPYSHEITHGSLLAFAALRAWQVQLRTKSTLSLVAVGATSGCAFLTKPEVFLALGVASAAALWLRSRERRWSIREIAVLTLASLAPPLVACVLFATSLGLGAALHATLGGWAYVFDSGLTQQVFYATSRGTHDPLGSLVTIAWVSVVWAGLAGLGVLIARAAGGNDKNDHADRADGLVDTEANERAVRASNPWFVWLGGVAALVLVLLTSWDLEARESPTGLFDRAKRLFDGGMSPLPVAVGLALVWRWRQLRDARREGASSEARHAANTDDAHAQDDGAARSSAFARQAGALVFEVFALVLLSKIILRARIQHYGFALAAPALFVVIVHGIREIPRRLDARGLKGIALRATLLGALLGVVLVALRHNHGYESRKTTIVGEGADLMYCDFRGKLLEDLVATVNKRAKGDATLLILPEGIQLNYLTRRRNPTGIVNFMPPEYLMFGEDAILERLERNPPDAIVISNRKTPEYGLPCFGIDYGARTMRWVLERYASPAAAWARKGKPPLQPETGHLLSAWFFFPKRR